MVVSPDKPRTLKNLATAVAGESRACLRHQHFAKIAAVAGYDDISQAVRLAVASGIERIHMALDFRWQVDRPPFDVALESMGRDPDMLFHRTIAQFERRYLLMARMARDEGFEEIARWFEMAAMMERSRVALFQRMLAS